MRDYTYIEGYRFTIWNIYRSKRFDVDRLDINFADKDMPEFVRGLRIVDHLENETYTVHGDDALDLEKSTRHATSFQNRIFKGFQMLALMDQHEKQNAILMPSPSLPCIASNDSQPEDQKGREDTAK